MFFSIKIFLILFVKILGKHINLKSAFILLISLKIFGNSKKTFSSIIHLSKIK